MTKRLLFWILVITMVFGSLLSACGSEGSQVKGSFAGKVDSSDAFISVVVHANGKITAYVCDGVTISEWFKGDLNGSSIDLTNANGAHLTANLSADAVNGTFTPSGSSALNFTTSVVTQPAGLYRAEDTQGGIAYTTGWIVLPDGDIRGARSGGGKISTAAKLTSGGGTNWIEPDINP
jgi:hypothetical protein